MLFTTQLVLAQVTPPADDGAGWVAWLLGLGLVVLMGLALRAVLRRRGPPEAPRPLPAPPVAPELQVAPPPEPAVSLPPSEAEAQRRAEAEALRAKAAEQQRSLAQAAEEAEKARLKDELEATRREAYRAQKAAEAEEKERRRREREEAQRLEAEAAQRAREEADRLEQERLAAERRKVAAEAGQTLAAGLGKTRREGFMARLESLFGAPRAMDDAVLAELEEVLFTADIGVKTASRLVELAREKARSKELTQADALKGLIRKEVARIVDLASPRVLEGGGPPHVVMVVGVNGAGKTTTIGKLAARARAEGKKVLLGAGDTFRAAATEQLDVWAERAGVDIVKGQDGADPASVVFDAVKKGVAGGYDLVLADTAGRLHTKANLMEELKKVRRVMDKALPGAPHEVLLVLDATNGQNAILQARQFHEAVSLTGIALTKLDGTAKGGVIIGICDELGVPVVWAGVGEKVADLKRFEAREFVSALFD
jgi:fused signal recognition particle receptor